MYTTVTQFVLIVFKIQIPIRVSDILLYVSCNDEKFIMICNEVRYKFLFYFLFGQNSNRLFQLLLK